MKLYCVGHVDETITGNFDMLPWTTEPPTEPGLYWTKDDYGRWGIHVEQSGSGLYVDDYYLDEWIRNRNTTHWLGPLPVPEPPKETS